MSPEPEIKLEYAGAQTHSPVEDESRPGLGSLVLSLFFFVPFLTAVMAIILGRYALRNRSGPTDRALGIAGLIIGFFCLVAWSSFILAL